MSSSFAWFRGAKRIAIFTIIFILVTYTTNTHNTNINVAPTTTSLTPSFEQAMGSLKHPNIEINKGEARISSDVGSISHVPKEAKIIVHFNQNRSCSSPQLVGRLSGLFLSDIKWSDSNFVGANGEIDVVGHYEVPSPGTYYIEIIATMCQQLDVDVDITNICVLDPANHRLTHANATIDATTTRQREIGFWYNNLRTSNYITPLHIRYQPQDCRKGNEHLKRCKGPMDLTRFDPYAFRFTESFSLKDQLDRNEGGGIRRVCFVGASHSRVLTRFAGSILAGVNDVVALHQDVRFAANLTEMAVKDKNMLKCTKVVIGMGHWDLARGTPFAEYKRLMTGAMSSFVKTLLDDKVEVYFRSTQ
jgi:hypothetical protein